MPTSSDEEDYENEAVLHRKEDYGTEAVTTLFDTVEEHTESAMAIVLGLVGLLLLLSLSLFVVRR